MLTYPDIHPIAFTLGPFSIRWYGIMYVLGFLGAACVAVYLGKRKPRPFSVNDVADLLFYCAIGVIFGGTIGYVLFYEPGRILTDPLVLFRFWEPGRSFHGGLIGVILAVFIYARVHQRRFLEIGDLVAPGIPVGLATGRLGNFLNGELWGRVTDVPWGMVFPQAGTLPRHPSQLYEFFLEGILLFILLFTYSLKPRKEGEISALFLFFYGIFRFIIEFFREPDINQGFVAWGWLTKGQLLSIPMVVAGLILFYYAKKKTFQPQHARSTQSKIQKIQKIKPVQKAERVPR